MAEVSTKQGRAINIGNRITCFTEMPPVQQNTTAPSSPEVEVDKVTPLKISATSQVTSSENKVRRKFRKMSLLGESDEPITVGFEDVSAAAYRIKSGIRRTPCDRSLRLSELLGMDVYLKRDYMQITGSFKERGARNTLLMMSKEQRKRGVIAASAGNHAMALAYHGRELNIPVTVSMPINAPITKVTRCRNFGARVFLNGADIIEAKDYAIKIATKEQLAYVNGYDHPDILAGQGACALEIAEQVDNIDAVVIPVGGGGLIAGCAVAFKALHPHIEVIGVESETCASFTAAMKTGKPVKIEVDQSMTLADGLCVPKIGSNAFATAKDCVDKIVTVSEMYIAMAVLRLVEEEKCVVEGAGATGLAAAIAGHLDYLKGKRVVFLLCGGNIDSTVLGRVIERGLAADGRMIRFSVIISDRPGGLNKLTSILAQNGASVKDIFHERAWLKTSVFQVENKVVIEVRDYDHGCQVRKALEAEFEHVVWNSYSIKD